MEKVSSHAIGFGSRDWCCDWSRGWGVKDVFEKRIDVDFGEWIDVNFVEWIDVDFAEWIDVGFCCC